MYDYYNCVLSFCVAGEFIFFDDLPSGADSGCEGDAEASADCDSSAGSSDFSSLDKALGFVRFDSGDFEEVGFLLKSFVFVGK